MDNDGHHHLSQGKMLSMRVKNQTGWKYQSGAGCHLFESSLVKSLWCARVCLCTFACVGVVLHSCKKGQTNVSERAGVRQSAFCTCASGLINHLQEIVLRVLKVKTLFSTWDNYFNGWKMVEKNKQKWHYLWEAVCRPLPSVSGVKPYSAKTTTQ